MDLSPLELVAVAAAAFAAGVVNAVAGGGTLITFPVMTAVGIPPLFANTTSTVALAPGHVGGTLAQRHNLTEQRHRMRVLLPVGLIGGVCGAALLLATGEALFETLVPFLILAATVILALQPWIRRLVVARTKQSEAVKRPALERTRPAMIVSAFVGALYGGYFGAGLGIVLLAALSISFEDTLTRLNALKQVFAVVVNASAAIFFIVTGDVVWEAAAVMAIAALAGGHVGGRQAARLHPEVLRVCVVIVGLVAAVLYLVR